jgi:hypothetical protein
MTLVALSQAVIAFVNFDQGRPGWGFASLALVVVCLAVVARDVRSS